MGPQELRKCVYVTSENAVNVINVKQQTVPNPFTVNFTDTVIHISSGLIRVYGSRLYNYGYTLLVQPQNNELEYHNLSDGSTVPPKDVCTPSVENVQATRLPPYPPT